MTEGLISVVMPTFNRADLIGETIESVLGQTYADWELIVVDDHSQDDTDAVIQGFSENETRIKCYRRPDELLKGPCSCRNYGYSKASGEYIVFFDSDDLMHTRFLHKMSEVLRKDENTGVTACMPGKFMDRDGKREEIDAGDYSNLELPEDFLSRRARLGTINFMFRSSVLKSVSLWDEKLRNSEDYELYSRILMDNICNFIEEPLVFNRVHSIRITSDYYRGLKKLVWSNYIARKRIYLLARQKGIVNEEIFNFILRTNLNNLYLSVKKGNLFLALRIYTFILSMGRAYERKSKTRNFIRSKMDRSQKRKLKDRNPDR